MAWLKPAIIFTALSSALLAATFAYTWVYFVRRRYALFWSLAWAAACPHLAFVYWGLDHPSSHLLWSAGQMFLVANAFLVVSGCLDFVGRRVSWPVLAALASPFVLWGLFAPFLTEGFLRFSLPNSFLLGGSYLWASTLFFGLARRERRRGSRVAAVLLAIAGVHEFDYPLLGQVPGAAPFGFGLAAGLMIAIALCLIVMMLEQARQEAEQERARTRAILDNLPVGVLVASPRGELVLTNGVARGITGDAAEGSLSDVEARLFGEGGGTTPVTRVLETGTPSPAVEFSLPDKDGGKLSYLATAAPVADLESNVAGAVAVFQEITELERMQREVARTQRLQSLGTLAAGVAHTFNNALTLILGHADLAEQATADPKALRHITAIGRTAVDSAAMVRRIQDVARARTSREEAPVDLAAVAREVIELARPQWRDEAQARGISYEVVSDLEVELPVLGNAAELREALLNLCLNALQAMPRGGKLAVSGRRVEEHAVLEIADTGVGMSAEVRERLFEPYFTTKEDGGSGLGLALVFGVVERHGGRIDVASEPEHGTIFELVFPIRGEIADERAVAIEPRPQVESRILVVDDEEPLLDVVARILSGGGHTVQTASTGAAGLKLMAEQPFDIVLTDLGMPGINGWQLAETIRERGHPVSVVLMTGWGETVSPNEAKERGVDAILPKPVSRDTLLDCVARVAVAAASARSPES